MIFQVIDICQSNPCLNGGICSRTGIDCFMCVCPFGFTGTLCDQRINPCYSSPCFNGATCLAKDETYKNKIPLYLLSYQINV